MESVSTIGLDIAKSVFHAHGADAGGRPVFSRRLTRARLLDFFAQQAPCVVALEPVAAHITGRASWLRWAMTCGSFRRHT
jgi:transposase